MASGPLPKIPPSVGQDTPRGVGLKPAVWVDSVGPPAVEIDPLPPPGSLPAPALISTPTTAVGPTAPPRLSSAPSPHPCRLPLSLPPLAALSVGYLICWSRLHCPISTSPCRSCLHCLITDSSHWWYYICRPIAAYCRFPSILTPCPVPRVPARPHLPAPIISGRRVARDSGPMLSTPCCPPPRRIIHLLPPSKTLHTRWRTCH